MTDYTDLLSAAEQKYGLPSGILQGQAVVESGGDPNAKSRKGALGLMQFTPATAKAYGVDPTDPASSIDGAARFMADNLKASKGNVTEALRLYQGGPNRSGWGKENAAYAGKVLNSMPGDSGDLAAMGFSAPTSAPKVTADDHVDLSASGMSAPADYADTRKELDGLSSGASTGDTVTDPKTGNKVPAVDPSTKGAFFGWGETDDGHRYPMYGPPGETPGKPSDSILTNLGHGFRQGIEDIGEAGSHLAKWVNSKVPALAALDAKTGLEPDNLLTRYATDRSVYDQTAGKTLSGGLARLGGNIVGTAPLLMGGEALLGSGLTAAGAPAVADFVGGTAGRAIAANPLTGAAAVPRNLLLRAGSLITRGTVTGAGGAALTGQSPLTGAEAGAVLAPAASVAGAGANKLFQAAKPVLSSAVDLGSRALGRVDPEDLAAQRVTQRIQQDINAGGPTAQDMLDMHAQNPGKPLTLMDLGGENLTSYAGRMARAPGESRGIITNTLNGRDKDAGQRVASDIRSAISDGGSSHDTTQALVEQRAAAAKPLYEEAYSQPPVSSPKLDSILGTPAGKGALARAYTIAANEGRNPVEMGFVHNADGSVSLNPTPVGAMDRLQAAREGYDSAAADLERATRKASGGGSASGVAPARDAVAKTSAELDAAKANMAAQPQGGSPVRQNGYSTQTLDYVKRGLDDQIEQYRDKTTGILHLDEAGRAINGVKNDLLNEMDRVNPSYKSARAAYSGPSTSMDALNRGRQILNQRPEANRDFLANLSDGDKEFFKQGAADALLEKIARTSAGGDETKRIIGNDYVRQQLRPLFKSDGDFSKFIGNIKAEARMFATRQAVLGNSATAGRVAEDSSPQMQAALSGFNMAKSAAVGHAPGVVTHGFNMLRAMADRRDPATNAAVANLLTQGMEPGSSGAKIVQGLLEQSAPASARAPSVFSGYRLPAATIGVNRLIHNSSAPSAR
jgi:hypothetical protein